MGNEVATKDTFSSMLTTELENNKAALPADFNIARFTQNAVALLNSNDVLQKFAKQYGTAQIKANLMRAAYLGLDALNAEVYMIPYSSSLNFMPSYKGMVKLCMRYSTRPIKSIYAKCVREGDFFEETIVNGEPTINFKPIPFSNNPIVGVFGICNFADGGCTYEVMSKADVEQCRKSSKAQNSPAWKSYWSEMAKKTVLRRLSKSITLDMDAKGFEAMNAGLEYEDDVQEQVKNEIAENANKTEFSIDDDIEEVVVE